MSDKTNNCVYYPTTWICRAVNISTAFCALRVTWTARFSCFLWQPWGNYTCFRLWCYNFPSQESECSETMQPQAESVSANLTTHDWLLEFTIEEAFRWFPGRLWWELIFIAQLMWNIICGGFHFLSDDLRATRSDSVLHEQKRFLLRSFFDSFLKFHFSILRGEVFITWLLNPHSCML